MECGVLPEHRFECDLEYGTKYKWHQPFGPTLDVLIYILSIMSFLTSVFLFVITHIVAISCSVTQSVYSNYLCGSVKHKPPKLNSPELSQSPLPFLSAACKAHSYWLSTKTVLTSGSSRIYLHRLRNNTEMCAVQWRKSVPAVLHTA